MTWDGSENLSKLRRRDQRPLYGCTFSKYSTRFNWVSVRGVLGEMKRIEQMERLLEFFNSDKLLEEVVRGMSNDEFNESYEFICRMWDIPQEGEEDLEEWRE